MVEHTPVTIPTFSRLLGLTLILGFFEWLAWTGTLLMSERSTPRLTAVFARFERALTSAARSRFAMVVGIFLLVFVGRLAALPVWRVPPPRIQDEFSQLLSADTLASGRLTNPTHPMAFYFETFFVNQRPTYHSMYPAATGLFMAAAQVLTGQPWVGMLFAMAAASAAVCWMLQGWVPPRWALWGTLVFVLLVARSQLTEGYLGEGIFVLGGALILGAVPRILKKQTIGASVWLAIGIALLATSRPFEGAFLVAGIGFGAFYLALKTGMTASTRRKKVVLPVAMTLLPVLAFVGYQDWRTTGSPWLAPYQLNLTQQHITRPLVWEKPTNPPKYDHPAIASFFEQWELDWWKSTRGFPRGVSLFLADKACTTYAMILWPLSPLVAVGSYQLLKNKKLCFLPLAFAFFLAGLSLETYQLQPRYAEPAWGLAILLAVYGIRYARIWKRKTRYGLRISSAASVSIPVLIVFLIGLAHVSSWRPKAESWYSARQQLSEALEFVPGKHLVLVRYSPSHFPQEEWVYNRADIDSAKVVWARNYADRGEEDLLRYFADRKIWLLEPDGMFPTLTFVSGNDTDSAVSEIGPFRVLCGDASCEELKRGLGLAVDRESQISIAETVK